MAITHRCSFEKEPQGISRREYNYICKQALLIYKCADDNDDLPQYVITQHPMDEHGIIRSGSPLTRGTIRNIYRGLASGHDTKPCYLPPEIIAYVSGLFVMWWRPGDVRYLLFANNTGIKSGYSPVPPALFLANDQGLMVWALEENKRPLPETRLHHYPLFNIHSNGSCCMGNIRVPDKMNIEVTKEYEQLFFGGVCNNDLPPTLDKITGKDLWNMLIRKKMKHFPMEYLADTKNTIENILNGGHI
ncbi:MAG: PRTRC system protein B [Proteobacteria bacterium]|nr:PRTRC system protein B [Pseudomonadota bacterium]